MLITETDSPNELVRRIGQRLQAPLFFSSQIIGSHSSTLFPSGFHNLRELPIFMRFGAANDFNSRRAEVRDYLAKNSTR